MTLPAPLRKPWVVLALILLLVLFKQVTWLAVVPMWQSPDEPAHFHYVQYLAETGQLPRYDPKAPLNVSSPEVRHTEINSFLNHLAFHPEHRAVFTDTVWGLEEQRLTASPQPSRLNDGNSMAAPYPPAYYVLAATVYRALGDQSVVERFFAVRLMSSLFLLLTVAIAFALAGELWTSLLARASFAMLLGFQPMLTFLGNSVNNDAMLIALVSAVSWLLLRQLKRARAWWEAALLGFALGLGLLVKPQMIALVPIAGLLLVLATWWRRERPMVWLPRYALVALTLAACYVPWLSYCLATYGAWQPSIGAHPAAATTSLRDYLWNFVLQPGLSRTHGLWVEQYWATFGWLDTHVFDPAYRLATAFMVLGAIGAYQLARRGHAQVRALVIGAFLITAAYLGFLYLAEFQVLRFTGLPLLQGRYWLPVVVPHLFLAFSGVVWLTPARARGWTVGAVAAGAVAFQALCLLRILERYYV